MTEGFPSGILINQIFYLKKKNHYACSSTYDVSSRQFGNGLKCSLGVGVHDSKLVMVARVR